MKTRWASIFLVATRPRKLFCSFFPLRAIIISCSCFELCLFAFVQQALTPHTATAQDYFFSHTPSTTEGPFVRHSAGLTTFIYSVFNPTTNHFRWEQTFEPAPGTGKLPDGLNLVVNSGFSPKNRQGEMVALFFDARDIANVRLTSYAYNGVDSDSSWQWGDLAQTQPADKILSSITDSSWINELSVINTATSRKFVIDINTAVLNSHAPSASSPNPWLGISFGQYIGIWAHSLSGSSATYDANGFLTSKGNGALGFIDIDNTHSQGCDLVPGSNKQFDDCGDCGGDNSSCNMVPPNCESANIASNLFELDSSAFHLSLATRQVLRQTRRTIRKNPDILTRKKARKLRKRIREGILLAQELYDASWTSIWSLPNVVFECEFTDGCEIVSTLEASTYYGELVSELYKHLQSSGRRLKRLDPSQLRFVRKQLRKGKAERDGAFLELNSLPSENVLCQIPTALQ
ncbi:MAG: hypothetical protein KDD70_05130 [Bdellovibrionales bacterium]|nr:hypothetical protein [Bdellovibrionales bacterium]